PTTIAVTSISLNKSSLSLTVGDSATLKATIAPSNATNKSYSFSSSNNSVATVNSNGTVVAKKVGSCTITVKSSNGKTAKCSVTVKAKATSSDNGGTSSTGKSGIASIPAGAKSYQTKSYDGKKTYTVYECPEVVKYINEYRKQAGLKEVKWKTLDYMNQHAYDTVYSIPEKAEEVKEYFPEDYEKAFDKNGNYVGEYNYNDWLDATQSTRNAVAYMLGTNAIYHADEMQWSASIQKTGGSTFNPSLWISNIKTSPDHWNMLMSSKVDAVYCTYGVTTDGYFYVAIL
ncbi:MAG: Ig domain-containing protein, partial [Acutalibacteraceae bacterium]